MTISKQIANCRAYLPSNPGAYARGMSAAIRAAMSDRAASALRKAIAEDKAERLFRNINTSCPLAVEG
jgi:hypothetical protein